MKFVTTALKILLCFVVVCNSILGMYLLREVRDLKNLEYQREPAPGSYIIDQSPDLTQYATKEYVDSVVVKPTQKVASAPTPTPVPAAAATAKPVTQVSYLPISGTLTTTNTDWADVPGSEFWADFNSDFGQKAKVSWEASLKVAAGSGRVIARLVDVTHGIELLESQIYTESGLFVAVTSGQIYPWAGRNLYKVQIRSLISTEATFGGGKVKVVY